MALSGLVKSELRKVINKVPYGDLYYSDLAIPTNKDKYTVKELLEYLLELYYQKLDQKSNDKSIAKTLSAINLVIEHCIDSGITQSAYDSCDILKEKYYDYIEENSLKIHEDIDAELSRLSENLSQINIFHEETVDNEEVVKLQKEIKDNLEKIKNLEKEINKKDQTITKRNATIETLRETVKTLKSDINELEQKIKNNVAENKNLCSQVSIQEDLIASLNKQVAEFEKNIADYANEIASLTATNNANKILADQFLSMNTAKTRQELIKTILIPILHDDGATLSEMYNIVLKQIPDITPEEIKVFLNDLSKNYTVTNFNIRDFEAVYKISPVIVKTNQMFKMDINTHCLDILVESDLHLREMNHDIERVLDKRHEYCAQHGISLILDLGDVYSLIRYYKHEGSRIKGYEESVSKITDSLPYDKSIHTLIMGGNHDLDLARYGFDPIARMEEARTDIVNLGYNHATIGLGNSYLGLHHFNKRFPATLEGTKYNLEAIDATIDSYYKERPLNQEDIYLDLLGHVHKSIISDEYGFATVPSLLKDRVQNGAYHLKIYFDESKNITNIVFIPLVDIRGFKPVSEVNYIKKLKK